MEDPGSTSPNIYGVSSGLTSSANIYGSPWEIIFRFDFFC